jgi:hypothetical protein
MSSFWYDMLTLKASWWLPGGKLGFFWDIEKTNPPPEGMAYATIDKMMYIVYAAIAISVVRYILDKLVFLPMAKWIVPHPVNNKENTVFNTPLKLSEKNKVTEFARGFLKMPNAENVR